MTGRRGKLCRPREEARERWRTWQASPEYRGLVPLRRLLEWTGEEKAARVLTFLQDENWGATNNGAERSARQFRQLQASCFRLRTAEAIEGAVKADAARVLESLKTFWPRVGRAARGRHTKAESRAGSSGEKAAVA